MGTAIELDDPADGRLGEYVGLRDPEQRRRREEDEGLFIGEGITVLERLVAGGVRLRSVLLLPNRYARLRPLLDPLDVPIYLAEREVMTAVAGFDLHRGVVAAADRPIAPPLDELLARARTVIVAEGLNDPENLGAIARTGRALGAEALLVDPRCADPFARRTVRVSMGEIVFLPCARLDPWPDALDVLRDHGFCLVAMTPAAEATSLFDWQPCNRVAVLLGAEGPGLSTAAFDLADVRLRIPMRAGVDSLNVGHAAAIALATFGARRA